VVSYDGNSAHASHRTARVLVTRHVKSPLGILMYSAWNPKDNYDMSASVFVVKLKALCHSYINYVLSTDINITETTYSCQF